MTKLEKLRNELALNAAYEWRDYERRTGNFWPRIDRDIGSYIREGFDACLSALQSQDLEFDNDACSLAYIEEKFEEYATDFHTGARWQFDQCKAQVEAFREFIKSQDQEIKKLQTLEYPNMQTALSVARDQVEAMKVEIERLKRGEHWTEQEIEMATAKAQQMRLTLFSDGIVKEALQAKDAEIERLTDEFRRCFDAMTKAQEESAELKQKLGVAREALENISSRTTDTEPPFKYAPVEVLAKYAREALAKLG